MVSFVYLHTRPAASSLTDIFYVGKGNSKKRARSMIGRNRYHASIVKKHGMENIHVNLIPCSSESIAFDLEKGLIKCLRRSGVRLANMTDGGEGAAGIATSAKQKEAMKGVNSRLTTEQRKEARKKEDPSANIARAVSTTRRHETMSSEMKLSISKSLTEMNSRTWSNPGIRAKRIAGMRGKKKTMTEAALRARKLNSQSRQSKRTKS